MIGKTISHYRILEKLGEGGMGVVYKASDTKLNRTVALKFLSPHLLANAQEKTRFIREAQAAAALNHPHICTIHEIHEADGHTFMVMEHIEGAALREKIESGPMAIDEAMETVIQVAKGLSKAHSQGIVHRDIKPGNVLITDNGDAKIVDFGLAKLATQTRLTKTGAAVGTVLYMSPEQARGDEVDHRTDVWSLGVMLYEMLAGSLPFRGEVEQAVVYSIMNEDPQSLTTTRKDVPVGLEDIIERALEKDPEKRYASVDEFLTALEAQRDQLMLGIKERRWMLLRRLRRRRRAFYGGVAALVAVVTVATIAVLYNRSLAINSIAVLPVANLSGDPEQEYLADGITAALITELGQIDALRVISRTSVMQYKEFSKPLPDIARELGVKAIVEASVLRAGDRVQMTVQLIQAEPEQQLWGESYDREFKDVFSMYRDVARDVAAEIRVKVTPEERALLARQRPIDPEAYEAFLRGRALGRKWGWSDFENGRELLELAIEKDPTFAPAYAELALAYSHAAFVYFHGPEILPQTRDAVMKALELDETLAEAHMALGLFRYVFEWDWSGADEAFQRALELNPKSAIAHNEYGQYLAYMGRSDEAVRECRRALYLSPLDLGINQALGYVLYYARRFDESIVQFQKTLELLEEFPDPIKEQQIHTQLGWSYREEGMFDEALAEIDAVNEIRRRRGVEGDCCARDRAKIYVELGRRDEVEDVIDELLSSPNVVPWTAAMLGDKDLAFRRLEEKYEEHDTYMIFLKMAVELESLRSDPRYEDLVRRMNFPD